MEVGNPLWRPLTGEAERRRQILPERVGWNVVVSRGVLPKRVGWIVVVSRVSQHAIA